MYPPRKIFTSYPHSHLGRGPFIGTEPPTSVEGWYSDIREYRWVPDGPQIYLDMDGVVADFDGHYLDMFGRTPKEDKFQQLWDNINGVGTFFADIPPCTGAKKFYDTIRELQPIILTACPSTNYDIVAHQKKNWIARYLDPEAMVLPVMGGKNKCLFMHRQGDILIDDHQKNLDPWMYHGGRAILHRHFPGTVAALRDAHPLYR